MNNKIKDFKNILIKMFNKFPALHDFLGDETYIKFLYSHTNCVDVLITKEYVKNENIICTKMKVNKNYSTNTNLVYRKYLSEIEKNIINTGEFYVYVVERSFPIISDGVDKNELDKFFELKNRRDFLVPHFFHKLTIETFSRFLIDDIELYKKKNKKFFKLLVQIRKYVRTSERLGVMLDSSITLNLHNIRENNDIDLVILHPRYDVKEIRDNLVNIQKLDFIDPYFEGIIEWDGEDKNTLDKLTDKITDGKVTDYFDIVFNPEYHYYFFGIKVVSLDYDLKYRAKRRFPKNVADLIITQDKLKIKVPKIRKLEPFIQVQDNTYNTEKFIKIVSNYLKRFNHNVDNVKEKIEELY